MEFSIARRALLIGGICVSLLLLAVSPAMATFAPTWQGFGTPGWYDWSVVSTLPGNIGHTSPHGRYYTTTSKCGVCHSVHAATTALGSEMLLPTRRIDSCAYCHLRAASGYTQVYGGDIRNYSGRDLPNAHNTWTVAGVAQGVTCTMCHHVHAAATRMTPNAALTRRLLINFAVWDPAAGAPRSADSTSMALTRWCAGCHFSFPLRGLSRSFFATGHNMHTHIMATATASFANPHASFRGRVAWRNSTYCMSCHSSGYGVRGAWPHMTPGVRFLEAATSAAYVPTAAIVPTQDGICLRCHRDGISTAATGVGISY